MSPGQRQVFRILLVEDEAADAEVLLRALEQQFANDETRAIDFSVASRAEGALKLLEEEEIHLVLTDVRMPGMGGIEFLKRVQALNFSIPVIMISGMTSLDTAVECIRHGAFDYITKPINPDVLSARIHRAIRMSEILHHNWALRRMAVDPEGFESLIGVSTAFQNLLRMLQDVAEYARRSYSLERPEPARNCWPRLFTTGVPIARSPTRSSTVRAFRKA